MNLAELWDYAEQRSKDIFWLAELCYLMIYIMGFVAVWYGRGPDFALECLPTMVQVFAIFPTLPGLLLVLLNGIITRAVVRSDPGIMEA